MYWVGRLERGEDNKPSHAIVNEYPQWGGNDGARSGPSKGYSAVKTTLGVEYSTVRAGLMASMRASSVMDL